MGRRAAYQEGWKLVADGKSAPWKLYNLADDPTEQKNLAKQFPERAADLKALWETWAQENNVLLQKGKSDKRGFQ